MSHKVLPHWISRRTTYKGLGLLGVMEDLVGLLVEHQAAVQMRSLIRYLNNHLRMSVRMNKR